MSPIKVSDASFQTDVLNSKTPVVVDFWAEWCGPCRMIAPALEELAAELESKVTVVKINIDENPNTPTKYGVRGVPTLMIFQQGQVAATKVGALPKSKIKEWIEGSIDIRFQADAWKRVAFSRAADAWSARESEPEHDRRGSRGSARHAVTHTIDCRSSRAGRII